MTLYHIVLSAHQLLGNILCLFFCSQVPVLRPENFILFTIFGRMPGFEPELLRPQLGVLPMSCTHPWMSNLIWHYRTIFTRALDPDLHGSVLNLPPGRIQKGKIEEKRTKKCLEIVNNCICISIKTNSIKNGIRNPNVGADRVQSQQTLQKIFFTNI